ncbi:MAG: hypothetical protein C0200_01335, partial [Thermoproteota archaeon]
PSDISRRILTGYLAGVCVGAVLLYILLTLFHGGILPLAAYLSFPAIATLLHLARKIAERQELP